MKNLNNKISSWLQWATILFSLFCISLSTSMAQDKADADNRPVRPTFGSAWILNNQSVMVNPARTLEMDIMHRFGTVGNGISDIYGLYAPSNIRIGFTYTVFRNLSVGLGTTKFNKLQDASLKFAIIKQTRSGRIPVSITYYGNMALDAREIDPERYFTDKLSYFHQLIIARKFGQRFGIQIAPSLTHFNAVEEVETDLYMKHDHISVSAGGRYRISSTGSILLALDQPITKHRINNPNPNIALGVEFVTSSHAFQIFVGNYYAIVPQYNNFFNSNNYWNEDKNSISDNFLIGFNITRLWGI